MAGNLTEVKLALAKKYERLATTAGSKLKRDKFTRRAEKYRRQAEELSRKQTRR
jgi:hypothetical protein